MLRLLTNSKSNSHYTICIVSIYCISICMYWLISSSVTNETPSLLPNTFRAICRQQIEKYAVAMKWTLLCVECSRCCYCVMWRVALSHRITRSPASCHHNNTIQHGHNTHNTLYRDNTIHLLCQIKKAIEPFEPQTQTSIRCNNKRGIKGAGVRLIMRAQS